jgi:hypothetical protein
MRSKEQRHEARKLIVEGASDFAESRWIVEAIIELCVTVEETANRIVATRRDEH